MSCKLQTIFLWFFKVSWIARMSKITFLKIYKSWNILQASNYFSMIFQILLDCKNVKDIFPEVFQVLKCLAASKYFSMIFQSLLDCHTVQNNFSDVLKALDVLASFKIIFYDFSKSPGLPECQRWLSWCFTSVEMSRKLQNLSL